MFCTATTFCSSLCSSYVKPAWFFRTCRPHYTVQCLLFSFLRSVCSSSVSGASHFVHDSHIAIWYDVLYLGTIEAQCLLESPVGLAWDHTHDLFLSTEKLVFTAFTLMQNNHHEILETVVCCLKVPGPCFQRSSSHFMQWSNGSRVANFLNFPSPIVEHLNKR